MGIPQSQLLGRSAVTGFHPRRSHRAAFPQWAPPEGNPRLDEVIVLGTNDSWRWQREYLKKPIKSFPGHRIFLTPAERLPISVADSGVHLVPPKCF